MSAKPKSEIAKDTAAPSTDKQPQNGKFQNLWGQLFGDSSVQVYFADSELNARVYTLDGESGYKVQHKKVGGAHPLDEPEDIDSQRLVFPKKARRGEKHGRAQFCREDILAIREWAATIIARGETPPWTAKAKELTTMLRERATKDTSPWATKEKEPHVSEGSLRDIVARRTWTHVK